MLQVTYFAPAKINLYLHVTGRRDDGYHILDSLVAFADIGDRITISPAKSFGFAVTGPMAKRLVNENPDANLVVRAARDLAAAAQRELNCSITLEKHLPVASGIGGGSSDAAATLLALTEAWRLDKATLPLQRIALSLGQDVPPCLYRRPCYMGHEGDRIDPAPELPSLSIVLVNPGVHVPTPPVFKARQGPFSAPARLQRSPQNLDEFIEELRRRKNDLYAPAIGLAPVIADCLNAVAATDHCLLARMSGSGATCFGLYAEPEQASDALQKIKTAYPGWWAQTGRIPFSEPEL